MRRLRAAPLAEFLEFDFAGDELSVLARPIIDARAFGTGKPYELILRHVAKLYPTKIDLANLAPEVAAGHGRHQGVYDEPRCEDNEEPDRDIGKYFPRFCCLA